MKSELAISDFGLSAIFLLFLESSLPFVQIQEDTTDPFAVTMHMALRSSRCSMNATRLSRIKSPVATFIGNSLVGTRAVPCRGKFSNTSLPPLAAYNPARQEGRDKRSSRQGKDTDTDTEQRVVLGWHATRNKQEERESVMTWLLLFGFFMSGLFFVVPEIMMFLPAILKAIFGEA